MPVNRDAPAGDIVEAQQQPRQRRFAGTTAAHHRHGVSGRDAKADVMQDRSARLVMEADVLERHVGAGHLQWRQSGLFLHFGPLAQHLEQALGIHQRVARFAINEPQGIEWQTYLQHEGIDQDEVAH